LTHAAPRDKFASMLSTSLAGRRARCAFAAISVVTCGLLGAGSAFASQLIDRNPSAVTLQLNARGEALLTYRADGRLRHVLAWGAENARPPVAGARQVAFQLDYAGGYQKYFKQSPEAQALAAQYARIKGTPGYRANPVVKQLRQLQQAADLYWKTAFHGGCGPYDGPKLDWAVITCRASDGSYWAVQEWQRELPDYGLAPTLAEAVWELRLSHWSGPLAVLTVSTDWAWHQWDHLFGSLTYLGQPAFGFHATGGGNPLDSYGRNVYIDTYDSAYGSGWRRENSALTHVRTGVFCYSFNPHGEHSAGRGTRYRITVIGPGVTPDVTWEGGSPGAFDAATDAVRNRQIAALGDNVCRPN
jgi:hypothetical protein